MDLILGSLAPPVLGIYLIYIKEKYRGASYRLLWRAIGAGFGAFLVAFFSQSAIGLLHDFSAFARAFFLAAGIEELLKCAFLTLLVYRIETERNLYNYVRTALVSALTFGGLENFMYVNFYFKDEGLNVALLRIFTALPMHSLCGICFGYYAFRFSNWPRWKRWVNIFLPWVIHGCYNFSLELSYVSVAIAVLFTAVMANLFPIKTCFE